MKKFTLAACVAIAAAAFTSCGNGAPSASLKNDVDTISYAVGLSQSDGVKYYLAERMGIDTAYVDEFLKGVTEGATSAEDKKKAAYYEGIRIGQQFGTQLLKGMNFELFGNDSTQTVSLKNIIAGFADGTEGNYKIMNTAQARAAIESKMNAIKRASAEKEFAEYKKQNEQFLADNAKKDSVQVLPSGVQYKVLVQGDGAVATDTTKVKVHYEGKNIKGQVFDSSYKRGQPAEMRPKDMVPGFGEALTKMPAGSKWEVYIPADLAYGAMSRGEAIKPFSALIFTIEVIK